MPAFILSFLAQLRFHTLFLVTATIFVTDLLIPDLIPFVDELLLGAMTLLFSAGVDYVQGDFLAPAGPDMNYDFS